jgi:sushi, von Willebrand factor type A, EGF and pentraxin domain-containing protein 1
LLFFNKVILCLHPPFLEHATTEYSAVKLHSEAVYTCLKGHKMIVPSNLSTTTTSITLTCEKSGWSGIDIHTVECMPIDLTCQRPKEIKNGNFIYNGLNSGSIVKYKCDYNYMLIGSTTQICGDDKKWNGTQPDCVILRCPLPEQIPNGKFNGSSVPINQLYSVVNYECLTGYYLNGSFIRVCLPTAKWSNEEPKCLPILCPKVDKLENGFFVIQDNNTIDMKVVWSCNVGYYLLDGSRIQRCLLNMKWSGRKPRCQRVDLIFPINILEQNHIILEVAVVNKNRAKREASTVTEHFSNFLIQNQNYMFDLTNYKAALRCDNRSISTISKVVPIEPNNEIDKIASNLNCQRNY